MTFGQVLELRDQIAEYLGPSKADMPGTAWIGRAQKELLAACASGALKMTGRSLHGGPSREIPAEAFATFRFFERDGVDCLGPPDLVDADCWRDLRLLAEDVRRVWPTDGSAAPVRQVTAAAPVPSREYGGKASQSEHDAWFTSYRDACIAAGKSPNSKADEKAGIEALGSRFDRARARNSRRRLAPSDWLSRGKRTGKT